MSTVDDIGLAEEVVQGHFADARGSGLVGSQVLVADHEALQLKRTQELDEPLGHVAISPDADGGVRGNQVGLAPLPGHVRAGAELGVVQQPAQAHQGHHQAPLGHGTGHEPVGRAQPDPPVVERR